MTAYFYRMNSQWFVTCNNQVVQLTAKNYMSAYKQAQALFPNAVVKSK